MRRLLLTLVAAVGLVAWPAAPASAHGDLVEGSPGPGDEVAAGSTLLRMEFDGIAEDGRAFAAVLTEDGTPVRVGDAEVLDASVMCARTEPLDPGVYTVEYLLDAADGHDFTGRYRFEVLARGGSRVESGGCADARLGQATEARTLREFGDAGLPGWLPWGLGGLGVLAVGLLLVRVLRERRSVTRDAA